MKQKRAIFILFAIPLLVFAGCSSDNDASSDETSTTTEAEGVGVEAFAEQVNTLCGESGAAMGEIFGPMSQLDGPPDEELLQTTYDALLAQLQDDQATFESMSPPAEQQADWDALLAANADGIAVLEEQGLGYFDDEESNTFAEAEEIAVEMGFDACGGQG